MKVSEAQVRQIIKEEIYNVINENDEQLDPGRAFSAKELAGVAVGGLTLERLMWLLQHSVHEHPEWKDAIENFLMTGHEAVHGVGNAITNMFENKKTK